MRYKGPTELSARVKSRDLFEVTRRHEFFLPVRVILGSLLVLDDTYNLLDGLSVLIASPLVVLHLPFNQVFLLQ